MAFKILCPGCETKLKLEKQPAKDIKLKCPKCEKVIKVKGAAAPAAPKEDAAEEPATAAPAAAKAAPAAAKKAGAKAAASKKKATKAKPAAASKKKKAKSAPADDWDDYEDFGDDFEDDYDDDYGDDDYEEPARKKKSKGKAAGGKVTAKGKGKGKDKKAAKSGGKGLKIGLAVLLGAAIIGGVAFGVSQMGGSDDTSDIPEGAAVAASGGDASNAGAPGGGGGDMAKAGGDDGSPDAAGQNIVNMRYLPKQTEILAHIKIAEIWASPLASKYKDKIPAEAMASAGDFATPEETESITIASWIPGPGGQASLGLGPIGPAGQQGPGGFGGMGGPPQDGMGGPPMGGGFPPMGGGMTPEIPENFLMVLRLKKSITASDIGQTKNTIEHKGQQIYEVTQSGQGQEQTVHVWLAEGQTVVAGQNANQVKAAIDQGTKEHRFAQFDFVNSNGHILIAGAPKDTSVFSSMDDNKSGDPVMDKLAASLAQGMKAVCLSINVTADVGLNIQVDCKNGTNAATIQQDLAAGLELGKTKLSEAMTAMGALGGVALRPVQGILNRSQASASGDQVTVSMDIKDGDITALSNSAGLFMGMAMGMGGGPGGDGGMPPGMSMSGGGFPSGGNDVPFGSSMEKSVDYSEDVALTFKYRGCAQCHIEKSEGGLSLASYESLMAFSSDNGKAITPNDPEASTLFKIVSQGTALHKAELKGNEVKANEVDKIRGWIEAGAPPPGTKASFTASAPAGGEMSAEKDGTVAGGGEKMMAGLSYAKDIAPIAQKHCAQCHINQKRGNFSMASFNDIINHSSIKGGKAVQPGNAFTSSLYSLVANGSMPKGPRKVPKAEADMIMKWISEGAKP